MFYDMFWGIHFALKENIFKNVSEMYCENKFSDIYIM